MADDGNLEWPDTERTREFVEMVRSAEPSAWICFEYHDGESALTAKALRSAVEWLATSTEVMMAVDRGNRVIIASGALSAIDEATGRQIIESGLEGFTNALANQYPGQVALAKIDRKGKVGLMPILAM